MKKFAVGAVVIGGFFTFSSFAGIIPGTNITVADGVTSTKPDNYSSTDDSWYSGQYKLSSNIGLEDNEVEPGNVTNQSWDLEGFFLDENNELAMVGGFNFKNGNGNYKSGDIFIDVDGNAKYGPTAISQTSNSIKKNVNGWDYAINLDFSNNSYQVYKIDANTNIKTPYYSSNIGSSPFEYVSGGTLINSAGGSFSYKTGLSDAQTGFKDCMDDALKTHNMISGIDLSFLGNTNFTAHFTMGCGNDNLIGKGTINVPEPGTFSLIGIGLLSLVGLLRFRRRK